MAKKNPNPTNTPAWKAAQQKQTVPKDNDQREAERQADASKVVVIMKTDYRDVAKKGDAWETDSEKAEELVRLGRAVYAK